MEILQNLAIGFAYMFGLTPILLLVGGMSVGVIAGARIPPVLLFGFIVVLCLVGAFGVRNNIADDYLCIGFGILGYVLRRFGIPAAPLILGVILGPLAERYFLTSMISYDNQFTIFFVRPLSATILALALIFLLWSLWPTIRNLIHRRVLT